MDSIHYYENIKKLSSGTVIELANEIEKLYNSMAIDEQNAFVIYLEFEFLSNFKNEIISNDETIGKYRFLAEYDKKVAELNKSKQHYKFLTSWVEQKKDDGKTNESDQIDLSGSSATEKIIYLHKLGVIDFLKSKQPFVSSTNSLATILSAIINEKPGTIQSMINPILSKKVDDKNNPLNSPKPVAKVIKQLNDIGFNLNKTN